MVYQEIDLDLYPNEKDPPIKVYCSQGDVGRPICIYLYYNGESYNIPEDAIAVIKERKPSGRIVTFSSGITISDSSVTFELQEQMTAESGICLMELSLAGDGQSPIGSANFRMRVEADPLGEIYLSKSEIESVQDMLNRSLTAAKEAEESKKAAADSADAVVASDYSAKESMQAAQNAQAAAEVAASGAEKSATSAGELATAASASAEAAATSEKNAMSATPDGYETLASTFNALGLYVDDDGDVCQED